MLKMTKFQRIETQRVKVEPGILLESKETLSSMDRISHSLVLISTILSLNILETVAVVLLVKLQMGA
jgi:hypothetical protein